MGAIFGSRSHDDYVTRQDWEARQGFRAPSFSFPVTAVLMSSVGSYHQRVWYKRECVKYLQELQAVDMIDYQLPDIKHNFYVGWDGILYEGRGWSATPSLTTEENPSGIELLSIAYIRAFPELKIPKVMKDKVKLFIQTCVENGFISKDYRIFGEKDGLT